MTIWFTSDHHFDHRNIIDYCNRPFDSVSEMNDSLVHSWNNLVSASDTVYYLGDFSLKRSAMETYAPRLNGHKILVAGNHDTCHPSNHGGKWDHVAVYRKYFDDVVEEHSWEDCMLHHMPYSDGNDYRFEEYRPIADGRILIHGHVHQRWICYGRQINVGVDVWNYEPVHEARIRELITRIESGEYLDDLQNE